MIPISHKPAVSNIFKKFESFLPDMSKSALIGISFTDVLGYALKLDYTLSG